MPRLATRATGGVKDGGAILIGTMPWVGVPCPPCRGDRSRGGVAAPSEYAWACRTGVSGLARSAAVGGSVHELTCVAALK